MSEKENNINTRFKKEDNGKNIIKENKQIQYKFSDDDHIYEDQAPPGPLNNQKNIKINNNGNKPDDYYNFHNNIKDLNLQIVNNNSQKSIINNQNSNVPNINNKIFSKFKNYKNNATISSEIGNNKQNLKSGQNSKNMTPSGIPFNNGPFVYPQIYIQENNQEGNNNLRDEQNDRSIDDRSCCLCCGTCVGTICIYIVIIIILFLHAGKEK